MENTPKNILIRAYFTGKKPTTEQRGNFDEFVRFLNAKPFLEKELEEYLK